MTAVASQTRLGRWWDADLAYGFRRSPVAVASALVLLICLVAALFAPWIAPHNPFDLATLNLTDALAPPRGMEGANPLAVIARRLEAATEPYGYPREGRDFSPHVTIARVKGPRGLDAVPRVLEAHARDAFGEVLVDRVRLKKSVLTPDGPVYSTVEEVPL